MPGTSTFIHLHNKPPGKGQPIDYLAGIFLVIAFWFLPTGADSNARNTLRIVFVSIVLEAIPFMIVGSLIGGLIESFVSRERLASLLPRRGWMTVCLAAAAGIVFPVCECAVVPVVRRLIGKGLPLSAAIGYLLGGPIVNPVVAVSTALAYAFDWHIVAMRMILGYGIAVIIGIGIGFIFRKTDALVEKYHTRESLAFSCGCSHHPVGQNPFTGLKRIDNHEPAPTGIDDPDECGWGHLSRPVTDDWGDRVGFALRHAVDDFLAVGHYLVIGAFIAALAQTYINRSLLLNVADMPFLSILLMMTMAILLNLCSEADAFIAASFWGIMPLSAQMAFMLTGPMFDLKLLLMYRTIFHNRIIIVLAALILTTVLGICVGLDGIIGVGQ